MIRATREKKTTVEVNPKKRTQKRLLLKFDWAINGCELYERLESLESLEENLRDLLDCVKNFIISSIEIIIYQPCALHNLIYVAFALAKGRHIRGATLARRTEGSAPSGPADIKTKTKGKSFLPKNPQKSNILHIWIRSKKL